MQLLAGGGVCRRRCFRRSVATEELIHFRGNESGKNLMDKASTPINSKTRSLAPTAGNRCSVDPPILRNYGGGTEAAECMRLETDHASTLR